MKIIIRNYHLLIILINFLQIEKLATDLQTELGLKYTPTSILYFNPKHDKDVTISTMHKVQVLRF